ncbi:MAG: type IV pilus assembly protein FimV, partial [Lysobacter sp.]
MHWVRHPSLKVALALALALASASAAALGLGQIEVKSRLGQPLVAEIPIISSDPAELEELRAGLASPETFARIGLQPPQGIVADLQFTPALDAAGRPVIRVTSQQPVSEPLLTFLVEVDWGQGRLVREYSALVDAPRTVSAPVQPPIDAPVISEPNVIERPPPATPIVATPPPATTTEPEPTPPDTTVATAVPPPVPAAPLTVPQAVDATTGEYGPVKAGESLSQIAGRIDVASGFTLDQSMIALLRANPDAFIGGNINLLKQGAVLRIPAAAETADLEAQQAMAIVRDQTRQWRQSRRAPVQSVDSDRVPIAGRESAPAPGTTRESSARLEIVPPGASRATRAGTQSGISAGGEGQMLRQELQETKESLAARDAELRELKGRVAELEKLQADQQQLLTLKDTELAAAQQRLAESNKAAATVSAPAQAQVPTATTAETTSPAQEAPRSTLPWVLGGILV